MLILWVAHIYIQISLVPHKSYINPTLRPINPLRFHLAPSAAPGVSKRLAGGSCAVSAATLKYTIHDEAINTDRMCLCTYLSNLIQSSLITSSLSRCYMYYPPSMHRERTPRPRPPQSSPPPAPPAPWRRPKWMGTESWASKKTAMSQT